MNDFADFEAFQLCREYGRGVAHVLKDRRFSKDPVIPIQLRKTVVSVYSNFSEGFERDGNREFVQFLSIAKGSLGESRGQLYYALDFECLTLAEFDELNELGKKAARCMGGLMRYLGQSEFRGNKYKTPATRRATRN
jgi:four helix bundle protein